MTRDQRIVATGAASGIAAMAGAMLALWHALPADPSLTGVADRIGFALQANAFAALPLLLAIIAVSHSRFTSEAIDPILGKEDRTATIDVRVVDNTAQQLLLFCIASLALSVNLAAEEMRLIAGAAIWFVFARLAFWAGYRIAPLYRAFGMAGTSYLNLGLLGLALWRAGAPLGAG